VKHGVKVDLFNLFDDSLGNPEWNGRRDMAGNIWRKNP